MTPAILYHGTVKCYSESIEKDGLLKLKNKHVYLTDNTDHAYKEALKHGLPVVICIVDAQEMINNGYVFEHNNDEWLIDHAPSKYILQVQIEKYQELKQLEQLILSRKEN